MQLSSDANCTVKGGGFSFAVRWRCVCCSLARFPKPPSPLFLLKEFMVVNRTCSQIQGFIYFDFVFIIAEAMAEMLHDVMATAGHVILPSSPETGLTSHCESNKL